MKRLKWKEILWISSQEMCWHLTNMGAWMKWKVSWRSLGVHPMIFVSFNSFLLDHAVDKESIDGRVRWHVALNSIFAFSGRFWHWGSIDCFYTWFLSCKLLWSNFKFNGTLRVSWQWSRILLVLIMYDTDGCGMAGCAALDTNMVGLYLLMMTLFNSWSEFYI